MGLWDSDFLKNNLTFKVSKYLNVKRLGKKGKWGKNGDLFFNLFNKHLLNG